MDATEQIYKNLTGVDLDEQRKIWDERSKGYYGEYCVFKELFLNLPGPCKFLMNLHVPTEQKSTTEIDLLMLHETGIFVFEIKHYKGTIYGDSDNNVWTQFFKTTKNYAFDNPVHQNGFHIRALKRVFPNIPMHSVVVFSNDESSIRVRNTNPHLIITVCAALTRTLKEYISKQAIVASPQDIEGMFHTLLPYSALQNTSVDWDKATPMPFYSYVDEITTMRSKLETELSRKRLALETELRYERMVLENELRNKRLDQETVLRNNRITQEAELVAMRKALDEQKQKADAFAHNQKSRWWTSLLSVIFCVLIIAASISTSLIQTAENERLAMEQKLHEMEENFQHVDYLNDGNIKFIHDALQISDIQLSMSPDLQNTALFSCTVTNSAEYYGIMFNKDSKYIIQKTDGTVLEYDMYGERLQFYPSSNKIGGMAAAYYCANSRTLKALEIYEINDVSEIEYIKITKVSIWKTGENYGNALIDDLALRVYSKSGN